MRLEGTLDAFSLPDIFQLLSFTKKTGTLHLRRDADGAHGVVHVREGAVTGGRGDVTCQALGRRIVGAGLVDDDVLVDAAELVMKTPGAGLAKALAATGKLDPAALTSLAVEQATDAVFELLRWPEGSFAFVMDEEDPDDLGAALAVEDVVAEGRRRLETWAQLTVKVPSSDAVVTLAPAPGGPLSLSREEWTLLSFVDGNRTVNDLVRLSGTGEYVVTSALADLAERGLVLVGERSPAASALVQRQQLLAALEGRVEAAPEPVPAPVVDEAEAEDEVEELEDEPEDEPVVEPIVAQRKPVIPARPEPFTPARQPEHVEEPLPALSRLAASTASARSSSVSASASAPTPSAPAASVGSVQGAHALAPETAVAASTYIDRDPSVNKSLLLRLIAGVRGL